MVNSFNKVFMGAAGGGADAVSPVDDEFNRVSFLSHFEGSNNSVNNAFDDGSTSNHTITANGNVTQGSFGPFARPDGEFAVHFDGEGFYHCAADADFAFGTGDFCMEAWCFVEADAYNYSRVFNFGPYYGNNDSHGLLVNGTDNNDKILYYDYRNNQFRLVSTTVTPIGEWFHIAVTKASNVMRLFYNGQIEATATNTSAPEASSTNTVAIGNAPDAGSGGEDFQGFISNARVVKGSAVYTANFTPSTSKLTAITNTKLLTCQSNRFVDNSAEAHAITIGGAAGAIQVSSFGPFLTSSVYNAAVNGASAYFDGSGDFVTIPQTTDMDLSGNFTVECWAYFNALKAMGLVNKWGGDSKFGWILYHTGDGSGLKFISGNNGSVSTATSFNKTVTVGQWYHIAVARTGNTLSTFVNGVRTATATDTANNTASTTTHVGTDGTATTTWSIPGYLSDVRVIKGTAAYNAATYTVPTAPLTAVTNTKLLLNMADGQAIDSAAQNNLTLYGNANTSTDQVKFGNAALHLDGTGDFAKTELSTAFGTGDFTIECFYYNSASFASANRYLFDFGSNGLRIQFYNGTIYYFVDANNSVTTTADGVTHNNWYHLAAVRYNSQMNLYINGVSRGTKNSVTTNLTERSLTIGDYGGGSQALQGFIDEFRISNFARYTSNFTAPTAAFPDKGQDA